MRRYGRQAAIYAVTLAIALLGGCNTPPEARNEQAGAVIGAVVKPWMLCAGRSSCPQLQRLLASCRIVAAGDDDEVGVTQGAVAPDRRQYIKAIHFSRHHQIEDDRS